MSEYSPETLNPLTLNRLNPRLNLAIAVAGGLEALLYGSLPACQGVVARLVRDVHSCIPPLNPLNPKPHYPKTPIFFK